MYYLEPSFSFDLELADDERFMQDLIESGTRCVAVSLCRTGHQSYEAQEAELLHFEERMDKVAKLCRFNYVHVSYGELWCLCNVDEQARQFAVGRTLDICRRAAKYDVEYIVVHTNGVDFQGENRGEAIRALRRSLLELAKDSPLPIAVENLPRTSLGNSLAEMREILDGMPENIKFLFDVNHVFLDKIPDFVRGMKEKLVALHVSDCDEKDERHWLPGKGVIDWQEFIGTLEEIGYRGAFNYEVTMGSSASNFGNSPQQVVANHKWLFDTYNQE